MHPISNLRGFTCERLGVSVYAHNRFDARDVLARQGIRVDAMELKYVVLIIARPSYG
jgi:hypothetical protein